MLPSVGGSSMRGSTRRDPTAQARSWLALTGIPSFNQTPQSPACASRCPPIMMASVRDTTAQGTDPLLDDRRGRIGITIRSEMGLQIQEDDPMGRGRDQRRDLQQGSTSAARRTPDPVHCPTFPVIRPPKVPYQMHDTNNSTGC
ncbi:hypothetical protein LIA77_06789 [Sarocladium implicatum]|nr:hypothetical protein LIA77_06789 [Sarocladium implicatum]